MQLHPVVHLTVDETSLAWLDEFRSRLLALEKRSIEKPVDLLQLIRNLPRGAPGLDFESVTTGANERRIILKPSDQYLGLMAALRAWDRVADAVK